MRGEDPDPFLGPRLLAVSVSYMRGRPLRLFIESNCKESFLISYFSFLELFESISPFVSLCLKHGKYEITQEAACF